ncbi:MAG: hydrogenase [Lentisphaeria bacterium]|nr:hydrogenase [Lentisphaeria bacterium]
MTELSEIILSILLLIDLALVASSRMLPCIRLAALHGVLIGLFPLALWFSKNDTVPHLEIVVVALIGVLVKGVLLPYLLRMAMYHAKVKRELEPLIGYAGSLAVVVALSGLAFYFWIRGGVTPAGSPILAAPVAFTSMIAGLFIVIARKKALTQVIGFLIFENGITVFGLGMAVECGLLVELGILLDVLVLVFVMGIAMFHINREFSHIDADRLTHLNEVEEDETDDSGESEVKA